MGGDRVTVRNLRVVQVDTDNHQIVVRGAIPGAPGGYVVIRKAVAPRRPGGTAARRPEEEEAMTLDVVNEQNEKVDSIELSDDVFGGARQHRSHLGGGRA